jgi:defect-in-organelle-trafficking protein DotC
MTKICSTSFIFFLIALPLIACTHTTTNGTETLEQLQALKTAPIVKDQANTAIRMQALQDTAMSTAAQSGLASRSQEINKILEAEDRQLNQAFNFNGMLLEHNVLPPVLVESRDSLNLASDNSIRLADRTYQIISQAKFVTAPPTWRDYLWMNYDPPPVPNPTLLPKSPKERDVWKQYVELGWNEGVIQAEAIYQQNLARLRQDYAGMVLYRKLLAQNMVSAPFVARTDLGITGSNSDIRIHDQVLRITALPALKRDSKAWKAAITP